jgi:hypothetical protein
MAASRAHPHKEPAPRHREPNNIQRLHSSSNQASRCNCRLGREVGCNREVAAEVQRLGLAGQSPDRSLRDCKFHPQEPERRVGLPAQDFRWQDRLGWWQADFARTEFGTNCKPPAQPQESRQQQAKDVGAREYLPEELARGPPRDQKDTLGALRAPGSVLK